MFADALYLKTDGDVVENFDVTRADLDILKSNAHVKSIIEGSSRDAVPPNSRVLDLCCGQGRHILELARNHPNLLLCGHDQSPYLISLAKDRATLAGVNNSVQFTIGDCRSVPYPDSYFDLVVTLGNSFGYFDADDSDRDVLNEIFRVLSPGGRLVIDLTDGAYMRQNFISRSWEWVDDKTFVCRERALTKDQSRLMSREVISVTTTGVIRDQFYQERLYSREELYQMLEQQGFSVCYQESSPDTLLAAAAVTTHAKELSTRKEDLGMMEQRMFVFAAKPVHANGMGMLGTILSNGITEAPQAGKDFYSIDCVCNTDCACSKVNGMIPNSPQTNHGCRQTTVVGNPLPEVLFNKLVVVMGDTSIGCVGKRNNTWNAEDLETRRKLMEALACIGYANEKVVYLDQHGDLIQQLQTHRDGFVFNICDEGLRNDALKELHVPAIVEALNILYSGAGPVSLAISYDKGMWEGK